MKKATAAMNNELVAINHELRTMAVTKLAILALHYAEIVVRMEQPALRSFIARFMKDESTQARYIPTIAKGIMEHDWLRSSYETLRGVQLTTEPVREDTIQAVDRSIPAAQFIGEQTPHGNEARLAADCAALDGWDHGHEAC